MTPIIGAEIGVADKPSYPRAEHPVAHPLFQCRFRWRENSIAFRDNRCVQHHAMWDYWPHTRSGHRVTVKGDKSV